MWTLAIEDKNNLLKYKLSLYFLYCNFNVLARNHSVRAKSIAGRKKWPLLLIVCFFLFTPKLFFQKDFEILHRVLSNKNIRISLKKSCNPTPPALCFLEKLKLDDRAKGSSGHSQLCCKFQIQVGWGGPASKKSKFQNFYYELIRRVLWFNHGLIIV